MKSALVTGTVTGIGKALCEELGKQGYNLTVSSAAGVVAVAGCRCMLPSTALLLVWCNLARLESISIIMKRNVVV